MLILISLTKNNGNKLYGDNNFLFGNCSKAISFKGSFICSGFFFSVLSSLLVGPLMAGLLLACVFVLIHILFWKKQLHPIGLYSAGVKRMPRIGFALFWRAITFYFCCIAVCAVCCVLCSTATELYEQSQK